jgi:hypothetical protein
MGSTIKNLTIFLVCLIISILFILIIRCSQKEPTIIVQENDHILGIYTEAAIDRLQPDIDSFIGTYEGPSENPGTIYEFVDDNITIKEGGISKKTTVAVDGLKGQYAGWFVQCGKQGTSESVTKDMSAFAGGYMTFWVKSPINLEIGIRSGNVTYGEETSKINLNNSNYPAFKNDDIWHKVEIPLNDLTGTTRADLKRIKIFFNVASSTPSGGTGGVQKSFWIDDVRWEKIVE